MTPPNEFWQFNIGHLLTLIAMLLGGAALVLKFSSRIDGLESSTKTALDGVRELTGQIAHIDRNGTQASQRALGIETELTKSNTRRLDNLDNIITKVAEMGRDIHWIKEFYRHSEINSPQAGRERSPYNSDPE